MNCGRVGGLHSVEDDIADELDHGVRTRLKQGDDFTVSNIMTAQFKEMYKREGFRGGQLS